MGTLFPTLVYSLCFATSCLCAFLLGRSFHRARSRVLFWSAICFGLLAVVNGLVILDMLILPGQDFRSSRLLLTVAAIVVLLFGFIWDEGD
jgi:cytochrome b subunit of formate dehydrogenase